MQYIPNIFILTHREKSKPKSVYTKLLKSYMFSSNFFFLYFPTFFFFGHATQLLGSQFPDSGSTLHPLHWQHRVLPLDSQGSPNNIYFLLYNKKKVNIIYFKRTFDFIARLTKHMPFISSMSRNSMKITLKGSTRE